MRHAVMAHAKKAHVFCEFVCKSEIIRLVRRFWQPLRERVTESTGHWFPGVQRCISFLCCLIEAMHSMLHSSQAYCLVSCK